MTSAAGTTPHILISFSRQVSSNSFASPDFNASRATGRELGLYVPLRAFPYLSGVTSGTHLRFFDDDPGLLGRYFDGFDVAIENRAGLEKRPPAHLIICSLSFGDQIAQRLSIQTKGNLSLTRWTDLFVKFERKVAGRD